MRRRAIVGAALLQAFLVGCGESDHTGGLGEDCGPGGVCDPGLVCRPETNTCVLMGTGSDAGVIDARVVLPPDAPPPVPDAMAAAPETTITTRPSTPTNQTTVTFAFTSSINPA